MDKFGFNIESFFEDSANFSKSAVIFINRQGHIVFHNESARKAVDSDKATLEGEHISTLGQGIWEGCKYVLETSQPISGKKCNLKDQLTIVNQNPIIKKGRVIGVFSIFHNFPGSHGMISELNTYKSMVKELDAIIDSIYDGLFITDGEGNTLRVNSSWEKITGLRSEDVIGKNVNALEREGYCSKSAALMVLEQKKSATIQYTMYSGKEVLSSGIPIFDENGSIVMVVTNVRDLTDIRRLSKQLEKSKKLTEQYQKKLEKLKSQIFEHENIVADSKAMKEVLEISMRVASVDVPVLITGQTGVGKEVVAEFIHKHSKRHDTGLLLKINCGAIPENLLETELFGYEKGAFTGASDEGKPGLFETAEGGTIILDEIGEMPLNLQVKLLRTLQDFEITRVGGLKPKKINVRIIAMANRDFRRLIRDGKFREDLFFRLNVVPIYIPPLKERQDDLFYLINYFMQKFNLAYNKNVFLSRPVIDILMDYAWPGNVRELRNIIERLIVVTPHDEIVAEDLPDFLWGESLAFLDDQSESLKEALRRFEIKFVMEAIKKYGSINEAAARLKINNSTIYRKLKRGNV